ncbi:MAG: hypothetical protein R2912_08180 [Eubacteriales bacterium]
MDEFARKARQQVATLQEHCDTNTVWFEQIITQDVVDFVAANQRFSPLCARTTRSILQRFPTIRRVI